MLDAPPSLNFVHSLDGPDGAVVFDSVKDRLYATYNAAGLIVAYDTNTFVQQFQITIGENIGLNTTPFDIGRFVASNDGRYLALATPSGIRLYSVPTNPPPPTPTPAPSPTLTTRRGMVFDHSGKFLYLTTSTGWIERYDLALGKLDVLKSFGGILHGIDIAPDDSFLLVAQDATGVAEGRLQKLSLTNGTVSDINYRLAYGEAGAWDVSISQGGRAFFTTQYDGDGFVPLRQIDLPSNTAAVRGDAPNLYNDGKITQNTRIQRSADRSRLYFLEANVSNGPIFIYDAVKDAFSPWAQTNRSLTDAAAAVSRNGALLATRFSYCASIDTAAGFHFVRSFGLIDGGVAFDAVRDTLYGTDSVSDQVIAYDTNNFVEKFRIDVGHDVGPATLAFDTGTLIASQDGRYLALETPSGIQVMAVPTATPAGTPAPVFSDPRDMVFDHAGNHLYITSAAGWVWPYNLNNGQLEAPYDLGGFPLGVDVAFDDSFLIVAQGAIGLTEGTFQKIDLNTRTITNLSYPLGFLEDGSFDVSLGANGLALGTSQFAGSGWVPLRQIDLSANAVSVRTDAPGSGFNGQIRQNTKVQRSADGTLLYLLESNTSNGPVFTYSASTNTFGQKTNRAPSGSYTFLEGASAAVNRNGSLLGTRLLGSNSAFLDNAPNFAFLQRFNGLDGGVAFDATKDIFYGTNSSVDQIVAYDTTTFAEQFRFNIGENVSAGSTQFGPGTLVASQDGLYLALMTPTSIHVFDAAAPVSTFAQWQQAHFTQAQLNDPKISGEAADPDGDGLSNLLEYAFHTDPNKPSTRNRPSSSLDANYFSLTYTKFLAATDLTYTIEKSIDLATWSSASPVNQVVSDNGVIQVIRAQVPRSDAGVGGKLFLRLRVSR